MLRKVGKIMMRPVLVGALLGAAAGVPAAAPPATEATSSGCLSGSCHAEIGALKHRHGAVAEGGCLACHSGSDADHRSRGGKGFTLASKGSELCRRCHSVPGKKKVVHAPVREGECTCCHAPHGAAGAHLLAQQGDLAPLCLGCHDKAPFTRKHLHGPVAEGRCDACHDPHESDNKKLLSKQGRELCLSCHEDFARKMQKARVVHPPLVKELCTSCHDPHGSDQESLLRQAMPQLCVGCHKEIGDKIKKVKVPHQPVVQGKGCSSCHSSHFSDTEGLLNGADQRRSCLKCHNSGKLGDPPLADMEKELAGKSNLHGPIKKGRCTGCHDPHGSNYPRILAGNYPSEFYAPYRADSYSLCLRCHDKNLLNFPETTIYTRFRDGSRNLHYVHVNSSKGRSCRACHESHASDGQKLVGVEGSRFGEWRVKTRLQLTHTGGSCAPGCHRRYSYDRASKKHDQAAPL
ncbi:cytochrome C [Geoanaerobacter pelophilus]|uniref:Cytochrome C n=2 Tax=Geoanaerobacter pelophilus TaxID=60036 RepID=A0ABQ0MF92_9BACT|nr:cytochrome C [Geoanaerobacter pelophilus]